MSATPISPQQVRIANPCPTSWDEMSGDNRARFCSHCNKHVHNLSALREDEAQRLICDSAGSLCVAYVPDVHGAPTPLAYAPQKRPRYRWRLVAMIAAVGGTTSAFATALYRPKVSPPPAPMLRGKMVVLGGPRIVPPTNTPTTCPAGETAQDVP